MKFLPIKVLAVLTIPFLFAGCKKSDFIRDRNIGVDLHRCSDIAEGLSICFESLITDSRCPEGAVCVWSGDAVVRVKFNEGGDEHNFNMSLLNSAIYPYPTDTVINGYKIKFLDLKPHPSIKPDDPVTQKSFAVFSVSP